MRLRLAALAAVALAGCPFHARAPLPQPREGEWAQLRDGATRRALLYDGLSHRATGTATHLSLAVREARARRLAEWLGWTQKELDDRLAAERAEAAVVEELLLSFYTARSQDNDLDAPRSVWRVALKVGSEDLLATRVTSLTTDATITGLFPYVGPFDVVYRVLLPRSPSGTLEGRAFVLEIASALGRVSIDFGAPPTLPVAIPWEPVPPP